MSDARALLKARRQEARITHPLASYNQAGQLKCSACGTVVKHASVWEGHLGSKLHRTNVARLKEEERAREEQRLEEERRLKEDERERLERGKRKADEDESESPGGEKKKQKVAGGFPDDFFSDPTRMPLTAASDDEDDAGAGDDGQPPASKPKSAIDLEYERFQQELLSAPDYRETYERATIVAEPEIAPETPKGFPAMEQTPTDETVVKELTDDEARRLKDQDERELIMDRYMEEERAQEEADMRVVMMKTRLEGLRRKREAAKATKGGDKTIKT
ncbi:hypothetical protein BDQ17DRAFT_1359498 [Cyathus striatus]|nr:hypothetical protein BDQ17DRAFT_1359498 [Cyathus striatus]